MKYAISLKDNRAFRRLYSKGKYAACSTVVIYWRPNRLEKNRLGITVSTKLGHAVVRNKIRRRLREIYRLHEEEIRSGMDLVIVARTRSTQVEYQKLDKDVMKMLKKLGLLKKAESAQ